MTLKQSLRLVENKDVSSFGYKKFGGSPRDTYPTFSICFESSDNYFFRYLDSNLTTRERITYPEYVGILDGSIFYQDGVLKALQEISDRKISMSELKEDSYQIKDFLYRVVFKDRNSRLTEDSSLNPNRTYPNMTLPFHISYKNPDIICFTRNSDSDVIVARRRDTISFYFDKLMDTDRTIYIYIHHPGQLTRSLDKPVFRSKANELKEYSNVILNINDVSVLRRRSDAINECDEQLQDDDKKFREKVIRIVGCVPSYWMSLMTKGDTFKECKTAAEMSQIYSILKTYKTAIFDSYKQPCDYMKVSTGVLQKKLEYNHWLVLDFVYMDDFYQEIVNVRDFGFESFWSGVGGFVGIFLGYSLLQIPDLLQKLWSSTANKRLKMRKIHHVQTISKTRLCMKKSV